MLRSILHEERGQDLVEFGLLASIISIAAIATIRLISPLVQTIWANILTEIS